MDSRTPLTPVAQYLRMSTEHQQYSFANQRKVIEDYAFRSGYVVVASYEDSGKSGLEIRHRAGLQRLLSDVMSRRLRLAAVLVYDVSRWGRFQDDDEAAHYEFICRSAGVKVLYCAEQFRNDGTVASTLLKNLKRSMAGEYSRELSAKVYAAQEQLVLKGFHPGGPAAYGWRRMAVSSDGRPRQLLDSGERSPFRGDHVTLVPGPERERAVIRRIFKMFLRGMGPLEIARRLSFEGIPYKGPGRVWSAGNIAKLLRNSRYAGIFAWRMTTQKLSTKRTGVPKEQWIIWKQAAIVSPTTFGRVQAIMGQRPRYRISEKEILRRLQKVVDRYGRLSASLISKYYGGQKSGYLRRLGSMSQIYDALGLKYPKHYAIGLERNIATVRFRRSLIAQIQQIFPSRISLSRLSPGARDNLLIDGKVRLLVWLPSLHHTNVREQWWLRPDSKENEGLVLLCLRRSDAKGKDLCYLLPRPDLHCTRYAFKIDDPLLKAARRLTKLEQLCAVADELIASELRQGSLTRFSSTRARRIRSCQKSRRKSVSAG